MRHYITFSGTDLRDYGVYISGSGVFNSPERAYEEIEVPGRNGALIGNEKRLENVELTYPAFVYSDFKQNIGYLRDFLLSKTGYQRLEDTYYPDEFRLAYYRGGLEVEPTLKLDAGEFELTFYCKPQRYLVSGETAVTFNSSGTISNPTMQPAKPLIRAYGVGSVTVNGTTLTITNANGYTDIDCEIMEAFKGTENRNSYIVLGGVDFPELSPGSNAIGFTGLTQVDITPRWWRT